VFQAGGGGTLGYKLGDFFFGGSGDFRMLNQYSEVTLEVGNVKGTTINIFSPTLGFATGPVLLKVDYQFLTQYIQSLPLPDGQKVSYEGPSGFRAGVHYKYTPALYFGGFYETLKFSKQKLSGGTVNDASLSMFQIGASITLKASSLWESEFDFDY
jgi:hypothetical protein